MVILARLHFFDVRRTRSLLLDHHARYHPDATGMGLGSLGAIGASFYVQA